MLSIYVINDLNDEDVFRTFCKKESQKSNEREIWIEKKSSQEKIGGKLYVGGKGYDNAFNTWIGKKRYCSIK